MFFKKSRIESDIDSFKAMQDKGSRVARREGAAAEREGVADTSNPDHDVLNLSDQTVEEAVAALVNSANEHQQSSVGANAIWEGKLKTEGSARIEGEISGEIEAGETVFIEKGARVRANIHARRVIVGGDLEGQIVCRDQLVVQRTGRLGGAVSTKTLVIQEGAIVHSQIRMLREDEPVRVGAKKANSLPQRRDSAAYEAIGIAKG